MKNLTQHLLDNPKQHRQVIQDFLNMVVVETQVTLMSNEDLEHLLDLYFSEGD